MYDAPRKELATYNLSPGDMFYWRPHLYGWCLVISRQDFNEEKHPLLIASRWHKLILYSASIGKTFTHIGIEKAGSLRNISAFIPANNCVIQDEKDLY